MSCFCNPRAPLGGHVVLLAQVGPSADPTTAVAKEFASLAGPLTRHFHMGTSYLPGSDVPVSILYPDQHSRSAALLRSAVDVAHGGGVALVQAPWADLLAHGAELFQARPAGQQRVPVTTVVLSPSLEKLMTTTNATTTTAAADHHHARRAALVDFAGLFRGVEQQQQQPGQAIPHFKPVSEAQFAKWLGAMARGAGPEIADATSVGHLAGAYLRPLLGLQASSSSNPKHAVVMVPRVPVDVVLDAQLPATRLASQLLSLVRQQQLRMDPGAIHLVSAPAVRAVGHHLPAAAAATAAIGQQQLQQLAMAVLAGSDFTKKQKHHPHPHADDNDNDDGQGQGQKQGGGHHHHHKHAHKQTGDVHHHGGHHHTGHHGGHGGGHHHGKHHRSGDHPDLREHLSTFLNAAASSGSGPAPLQQRPPQSSGAGTAAACPQVPVAPPPPEDLACNKDAPTECLEFKPTYTCGKWRFKGWSYKEYQCPADSSKAKVVVGEVAPGQVVLPPPPAAPLPLPPKPPVLY